MAAPPIERFKGHYTNWRYNPFTGADMAVDGEEDDLVIPSGAPFVIQLVESPRKNVPTSVLVRAYDAETTVDADSALGQKVLNVAATVGFGATDKIIINRGGAREEEGVVFSIQSGISLTLVGNLTFTHTGAQADAVEQYIEFTETAAAPAVSEFRVDYPPADGEGTGLIEFNAGDANKVVRINYKATGSPSITEFMDTKVSYPAGDPVDHQILGFVTGAPDWRNNPIRYFHEGPVIYNAAGEDESCLLFRFKRTANEGKVYLELKGAKLHQGLYSELAQHNHGVGTYAADGVAAHQHAKGTLAADAVGTHTHGVGTYAADAVAAHSHAKGDLTGSQVTHTHASGTLAGSQPTHAHADTFSIGAAGDHTHGKGTLAGSLGSHTHGVGSYATGNQSANHSHTLSGGTASTAAGTGAPTHVHLVGTLVNSNQTASHNHGLSGISGTGGAGVVPITGDTAAGGGHSHAINGAVSLGGDDAVTIAGSTAAGGGDAVTIAGATAMGGGHGHVISGASAANGGHGHVISGSSANAGDHGHTISGSSANAGVVAKTYGEALKVYINGVDKTADLLALSALAAFGDGTAGHAFNTVGSGELNISALVAAAQFHEIKVTAPTAANGGRVMLHLELY